MMRGDLKETLHLRARELFELCDPDRKGYATKEELRTLRGELPLPPAQLDVVFDALDANGDGKLTLNEFTDGFGIFLGIDSIPRKNSESEEVTETEDDEEELEELLDHLGARNLFTDEEYLREMWQRVRKDDPVMRSNFENFIAKMAGDLRDFQHEKTSLQTTLNNFFHMDDTYFFRTVFSIDLRTQIDGACARISIAESRRPRLKHLPLEKHMLVGQTRAFLPSQQCRRKEHDNQVQSLYMEMEEQLRQEKERILDQEQRKEQRIKDELESELQVKDQQLKDLLEKHAQMESQLEELYSVDSEKKYENIVLQKDRDTLESKLAASERMLHDMKSQLSLLRKRSLEERRKRAQAAFKVSEGIALERENLVLELHHLKEVNKQLQDEKDELALSNNQMLPVSFISPSKVQTEKSEDSGRTSPKKYNFKPSTQDENINSNLSHKAFRTSSLERKSAKHHPLEKMESFSDAEFDMASERGPPVVMEGAPQNDLNAPLEAERTPERYKSRANSCSPMNTPRKSPLQRKFTKRKSLLEDAAPTRVFKVVFVGDSGVGKTSILQRFCTDNFKSTFSATIGVDFQVKTVEVDGERIALQLWDTAGQERFRSMTHQYFRKADGIIIVYDVTSEITFRNVRNWVHNIREGTQEGVIILLIGNKVDLCESEFDRVVRTKDGVRLADEYGSLFYETSAKTGSSICEAIESLASVLKTKEDEAMEHVLKLQEEGVEKRKRRCC